MSNLEMAKKFLESAEQGNLDEIRNMVSFEQLNLHHGPFPNDKEKSEIFDIILCRNVLIYFDVGTRKATLTRLINNLEPHGCILFGHTEMMQNISDRLQPVRYGRGYYYELRAM